MDVRSIESTPMVPMHQGTTPVWYLWEPRELKDATAGGYLELVGEDVLVGASARTQKVGVQVNRLTLIAVLGDR